MTNRAITILLIVLTTAALLGEAVRGVMEPEGRWREWLHLLVAQQVADAVNRQVQLGPLTDLSLEGVDFHSLAVAETFFLRDGIVLEAERMRIAFDAVGMLRGHIAPAAGISEVNLTRAWAHIIRDEQGDLNIEQLVPKRIGPPPPPEDRFRGIVTLEDSLLIYDDYAVETVTGQPLSLELASTDATADLREIGWADVELTAVEQLGRFGRVTASAQTELETGFIWGKTSVSAVDAAYWADMFLADDEISVQGGSVDLTASLGMTPRGDGSPETALAADVTVSDAVVTLAALNGAQVTADATLTGTPEGAEIHSLDARVRGTSISATGFVGDLDDPIVDLTFESDVARADELLELAPELEPQMREAVDSVAVSGPMQLSGRLVGPVNEANLTARIDAPGGVRYASADVGEIVLGPLDLRVDLLDLSDPNIRAQTNTTRVEPVNLEPLRTSLPEELQGPISIAPLEGVSAEILWSAETPVVQTQLSVPQIVIGDISLANLTTEVAVAGDLTYLSGLRAEPLGAQLSADAVLDLGAEDGLWAWAEGEIAGLELERLRGLPGMENLQTLSGELSGSFAGEYARGTPYVVADAVIERPAYEDYIGETLRALVIVDEDAVEVLGANLQDAAGVAWVRGIIPFEGELAAGFAVAGIDLDAIVQRFDLDVDGGLRGELFMTGSATGTAETPRLDATLRAYNVLYDQYEVDALTAEVAGDLDALEVSNLFASSGRIVVQANATLTEIDLEELNAGLSGSVRVAGPVDQRALELAELGDEDIAGAISAELDVDGTLARPNASGTMYLAYGRFETLATDEAILAVNLQGDTLQLSELRVPIGDAVVSGTASVTSLYDEPIVSATLSVQDLVLQDLALLQGMGLPLSGTVNLPYLNVQGALDDLRGIAQIEAADIEVGEEPIGAISAAVLLDRNELTLRRTTLALAGGELSVDGRYRLDEQRILPSHIELDDVSLSELLQVAVPVGAYIAEEAGQPGEDGQDIARKLTSLSLRLGGRLDGSLSVEGTIPEGLGEIQETEDALEQLLASLQADADLTVRRPSLDNKLLPDISLRAQLAEEPEVALQLEAAQGETLITADGAWAPSGEIEMLAEVSALNLSTLREWAPDAVRSLGGSLNLTVQASGTVDDPRFVGSVDVTEPETYGVKFDLVSAPLIRYDGEFIDIDSLVVRESDEEFVVDGRIPLDWATLSVPEDRELQVEVRSDGTSLAILPPLLADAANEPPGGPLSQIEANGSFDTLVTVTGTPRRPELNGELTAEATSIQTPWMSSPVEDVALALDFTGGAGSTTVEVESFTARAESTTLEAGGTARLSEYELAELQENSYDLWATVSAERQAFGAHDLTVRELGGRVSLVTQAEGLHVLTVDEVGGRLGNGRAFVDGTVGITTFVLADAAENDVNLAIIADEARPRYGNLFLGTVEGRIDIANGTPGEQMDVAGTMTLSHAELSVPLFSPEEGAGGLYGMSSDVPPVNLGVRLAIGPDVRLRTTGLTAPLEPSDAAIRVEGTPQEPRIQGQIVLQEGEARVSGGVLDIEQGRVQFVLRPKLGSVGEAPYELELTGPISITATTTIGQTVIQGRLLEDVEIRMQVTGQLPNHLLVEVSSNPPLADEQIYALLGTAPFPGAGSLLAGGDLDDVLNEQFVSALGAAFRAYIFQPFEEDLKELLGLSVFEVGFAFNQPVDVRIGGYLVENLLITYETSLVGHAETQYELEVSYKVQRQFELTYGTDSEGDNRFLVEYVREF